MKLLHRIKSTARNLVRRRETEQELDRETQSLLELLIDEKQAAGLSEAAAYRQARMDLGGPEQLKERVREVRAGHLLEDVLRDLRFGARMLMRSPGFTTVTALTLAIGFGANTAIFSLVNAVLLRPLPYSEPERLIRAGGLNSWPDIRDWTEMNETVDQWGAYVPWSYRLVDESGAEKLDGARVIGDLFDVLGVPPAKGRTLSARDSVGQGAAVLLLSHRFWRDRFAADEQIVGRSVLFGEDGYTVVGVMPPGFELPGYAAEVWTPQGEDEGMAPHRGAHSLVAIGRLEPDATLVQAQADIDAIAVRLEELYPEDNTGVRYELVPLLDSLVSEVSGALWLLLGGVGFVLLIACVNVASLLLSRAEARRRETVIRAALGAGRSRLVRQRLTESLLLSMLGAALGLSLAWVLTESIVMRAGRELPRLDGTSLDVPVLLFALALAVLIGLVFGIAPAPRAPAASPHGPIVQRQGSHRAGRTFLDLLVVSEIALALLLLTGAGLMLLSLDRLLDVDPGFDAEELLVLDIGASGDTYRDIPNRVRFFDEVEERLRAIPGVSDVALATDLPLDSTYIVHHEFLIDGRPPLEPGTEPSVYYRSISAGYFAALDIPVKRGRSFDVRDRPGAPQVAMINETMARQFFPDTNPIGKRVRRARGDDEWKTIVGIAGDTRPFGLDTEEVPAVYYPHAQESSWWKSWMLFAVRTSVDAETLSTAVRAELAQVDNTVPLGSVRTMQELLSATYTSRRVTTTLLATFAALALILAAIGIYGVVSGSVRRRTGEIGVRTAMGARRIDNLLMVLWQGLRLAVLGVGLGLLGALALTRLLGNLLFDVSATDPFALAGVAVLLAVVALLACLAPAVRATHVDPIVALRYE